MCHSMQHLAAISILIVMYSYIMTMNVALECRIVVSNKSTKSTLYVILTFVQLQQNDIEALLW
jgi:hypothetical protein